MSFVLPIWWLVTIAQGDPNEVLTICCAIFGATFVLAVVVLAVGADPPGAEEPPPRSEPALLLQLAREVQVASLHRVVLALALGDAVDEDREVPRDLLGQPDDRPVHGRRL